MKILVIPNLNGAFQVEQLLPHAKAEIEGVWELYVQGVVREIYGRADQPRSAVLMVESESVEAAKVALSALPLVRMGALDLEMIPLGPFTNLARLFEAGEQ